MKETIFSANPATGEIIKEYELLNLATIHQKINLADERFQSWKRTSFSQRAKLMNQAAEVLEKNIDKYAKAMSKEMGKTFSSSQSEVQKCAWVCRYYADNAAFFLRDEQVETDASTSYICYRPLGAILAVMPWNYPFWQVFRFAAPALMAGNVGLLKHASNVPQSALFIEEVFQKAGFPEGCFQTLLMSSKHVESILENPKVKAATLTGSGPAGSAVAAKSGDQIKKTVLELGGSDAYIILEDADLPYSAEQCKQSRLLNTGQSCIGAKRFIVLDEVYEEWLEIFVEKMKSATMGDPMKNVDYGPLAREDLRNEVHKQVLDSVKNGAKIILGGEIPKLSGSYYPATILVDVKEGMPAYHDEIFGPVASVIRVKDEAEAIKIANDTSFGLGSCVFTKNLKRGERIAAEEMDAGSCFVNHFVKSDPRLPFGGIKTSGYGRELSYHGIREFVNIKTIYIK